MEFDTKIWFLLGLQKKTVTAFIINETVIQIGNQHFWLWFCIEAVHNSALGIYISEERNMVVDEKFIRFLVSNIGNILPIQMVIPGMIKPIT